MCYTSFSSVVNLLYTATQAYRPTYLTETVPSYLSSRRNTSDAPLDQLSLKPFHPMAMHICIHLKQLSFSPHGDAYINDSYHSYTVSGLRFYNIMFTSLHPGLPSLFLFLFVKCSCPPSFVLQRGFHVKFVNACLRSAAWLPDGIAIPAPMFVSNAIDNFDANLRKNIYLGNEFI